MKHTKLLTLAIAALFAGSAMAETLVHWQSPSYVHAVGADTCIKVDNIDYGHIYWGSNNSSKSFSTEDAKGYVENFPSDMKVGSGKKAVKLGSSDLYLKVYLTSEKFYAGDTIFVAGYLPWEISSSAKLDGDIVDTITTGDKREAIAVGYATLKNDADTLWLSRAIGSTTGITALKITRRIYPTNEATLSSISVDGEPIADFDPETLTYSVELPFGTTAVPTVTATATSKKAQKVEVTPATDLPGATTITVTAEDGKTTKIYTVNFTIAATASSEKELLNVKIGNQAVTFEGNAGILLVSKSADLTQQVITFEVSDLATASIVSGSTQDFTNPLTITVTAQDLSTATYTITLTKATVDVLYLTKSSVEGDKLYNVIASKDYYIEARANGTNTDFSGYDLVVLHESLDGKAAADGELKAVATADVPVLNTKAYFYSDGRWGWGAPDNGNSQVGVKLNTKYTNIAAHPLFAGFTTDSITLFTEEAAKNIQPIKTFTAGKEGYALANVPAGVAIHELPASARLAEGGTSKYLLISLFSGSWGNLSTEAETLLSNAVDYLLGTQAWAPQTDPTAIDATSTEAKAVKRIINGQLVIEKNGLRYNAQGIAIE